MGAGSSSLTGSELECFAQVVDEKPWSIDDERWESLLRLKSHPWLLAPETLMSDFAGLASLLAVNDEKSHNLSTLAVHVASRLPRVQQFYRTEIEQTIAGVVRSQCRALPPRGVCVHGAQGCGWQQLL